MPKIFSNFVLDSLEPLPVALEVKMLQKFQFAGWTNGRPTRSLAINGRQNVREVT